MNILLIQPPDAPVAVAPRDSTVGSPSRFVPSWDLLCLRAHILNRTRFGCEFVDTRFFNDMARQLADRVAGIPDLRLAVVQTTSLGLGPAAAVIELLRRIAPYLRIAICGQHPSQFPAHSDALPDVDFALCGDPEPILRNLMDCLDVESRLRRAPGLRLAGQSPVDPYWLPDLKSLSLPDWAGVTWAGYTQPAPRQGAVAEMRLSRGHSRTPADRAFGGMNEPMRVWPLDRAASSMQKCGSVGIVEVFISDPPGFWSESRLRDWCAALQRAHSSQPWSFQLLPTFLSDDLIRSLQMVACRRVEFILPSAEAETLSRYDCHMKPVDLARTIEALKSAGIDAEARFWLGGPEEHKGERERVVRLIRQLNFCPYSLHAFPLAFDAPLFQDVDAPGKPSIATWIKWARDPWMAERPTALWGDQKARDYINNTMDQIQKLVMANPGRRLLRAVGKFRNTRIIESLENLAIGLMRRASETPKSE